ncbi:fasciclin-like arabinogalactan protein 10 [Phragmites australis]|uniref:fasciclin-like arabinogalactan protein 10 n=1 Tax=Phragmites australis TaxID=29695 RepID=UPI002D7815F4|nr:fasciclin-like arabinogalactan protein 10 [Phragmites australis]
MAMRRVVAAALLACLLLPMASVRGRNITAMLGGYKEYKLYNKYLSETKVCDEINARQSTSMTILVLSDDAMSKLVSDAGESLAAIKNALRLLSVLDYYDRKKVKKYGSESAATLYQATGDAVSTTGNVKVTDQDGSNYGFASATPGAKVSTVTKEVKTMSFKFSILEISAPVEFDGLFDTPTTSNLTRLLEKAGCKRFAALVASTGVLKTYESAMDNGLTLFAPDDDAFQAKGALDVKNMSSADLVTLLKYHALPEYYPKTSLKAVKGPLRTLASTKAGKDDVSVVAQGDDVSLATGGGKSRVADTVLDNTPFCLLKVDSLLVPAELAGAPEPAAPAPSPTEAPQSSPPAPQPADASSVAADHADHKSKKASSAVASRSVGGTFAAAAVCSVVLASLL